MTYAESKIAELEQRLKRVEVPWLRARIRDWQSCHGWLMRPYYRDLVKVAVRDIRHTRWAIEHWKAL